MAGSVVLTAAVSATVAACVSALFKWGGELAVRIRAWFRPDHAPLGAGEWQLYTSFDNTPKVRVLVACAPTRSLRKQEITRIWPSGSLAVILRTASCLCTHSLDRRTASSSRKCAM